MSYPKIYIKKGRERSLNRFHPWVFSGSIHKLEREIDEGEVVQLQDITAKQLGVGHYCGGSISVKMLAFELIDINEVWYLNKLQEAKKLRTDLFLPSESTNAYRLVHGEGDGLPGLIVDIYNGVAVIQTHSKGMELAIPIVVQCLKKIGYSNIIKKPIGAELSAVLMGEVAERIEISENDFKLNVDVVFGQKTGFFLDQRDNRLLLSALSQGKAVLNVFSYTGGFSVAALKGGATQVISVDSATKALEIAEENAMLNDCADKHSILKIDAVKYLENMEEQFDIIVLDPPAFAKHKSARHNAIQAYRRINESAIRNLKPGGLLMTFSCSQVIDKQLFADIVASAAINVKRNVRVLSVLRQPMDHPVSIFHPEGEYLKGLILKID
jgi:23S rRNA (cytosine1962-C5)-methyltransferase